MMLQLKLCRLLCSEVRRNLSLIHVGFGSTCTIIIYQSLVEASQTEKIKTVTVVDLHNLHGVTKGGGILQKCKVLFRIQSHQKVQLGITIAVIECNFCTSLIQDLRLKKLH